MLHRAVFPDEDHSGTTAQAATDTTQEDPAVSAELAAAAVGSEVVPVDWPAGLVHRLGSNGASISEAGVESCPGVSEEARLARFANDTELPLAQSWWLAGGEIGP